MKLFWILRLNGKVSRKMFPKSFLFINKLVFQHFKYALANNFVRYLRLYIILCIRFVFYTDLYLNTYFECEITYQRLLLGKIILLILHKSNNVDPTTYIHYQYLTGFLIVYILNKKLNKVDLNFFFQIEIVILVTNTKYSCCTRYFIINSEYSEPFELIFNNPCIFKLL